MISQKFETLWLIWESRRPQKMKPNISTLIFYPTNLDRYCGCSTACNEACVNAAAASDCCVGNCARGIKSCNNRRFVRVYNLLAAARHHMVLLQPSPIDRIGLFAAKSFDIGDVIIFYKGKQCDNEPISSRAIRLKNGKFVDAEVQGNEAGYVNHSCQPNAQLVSREVGEKEHMFIVASSEIVAGAEITVNYGTTMLGGAQFHCNADCCRPRE